MILKIFVIFIILVISKSNLTKSSNAFNISCFKNNSLTVGTYHKDGKIYFPLKTFYVSNLFLDLRHINKKSTYHEKAKLII